MNPTLVTDQSLFRRTVVEVASLPDDDLAILLDIVALLKQQRATGTVADIRRTARQHVMALRNMSPDQLVTQFRAVGEKIRNQAVTSGTAIEGDWEGD